MKKKKQPTLRAARREHERGLEKLLRQREKLARLEPGGSDERPIELESASLVEPRSRAEPCLRCGGEVRNVEHRAELRADRRLRIARIRCVRCGYERVVYFRLISALPS